jgi:hypothetical protein
MARAFGRTPVAYRSYLREQMRYHALDAVRSARIEARERTAKALAA